MNEEKYKIEFLCPYCAYHHLEEVLTPEGRLLQSCGMGTCLEDFVVDYKFKLSVKVGVIDWNSDD